MLPDGNVSFTETLQFIGWCQAVVFVKLEIKVFSNIVLFHCTSAQHTSEWDILSLSHEQGGK